MREWRGLKVPVEPKREWEWMGNCYNNCCVPDMPNCLIPCAGVSCNRCIYSSIHADARKQFYIECFLEKPKKFPKRDSQGRFCKKVKALTKLTVEVFNRPDCPEWAQYAAVDKCGLAYFFENKPSFGGSRWHDLKYGKYDQIPGGFYDTLNCGHSLIESPKKAPERGFYYSPSKDLYYYIGLNKDPYKALICGSNGAYEDLPVNAYRIKTQTYSSKELIGRVVKIIRGFNAAYYVITCANHNQVNLGACEMPIGIEVLERDYTFKDGSPCFKVLPQ